MKNEVYFIFVYNDVFLRIKTNCIIARDPRTITAHKYYIIYES